jgi:hypothetical protein
MLMSVNKLIQTGTSSNWTKIWDHIVIVTNHIIPLQFFTHKNIQHYAIPTPVLVIPFFSFRINNIKISYFHHLQYNGNHDDRDTDNL